MSSTPVEVRREGELTYTATNDRGGRVIVGSDGAPDSMTPGELLLAAIASCSALTSENLFTRRLGEQIRIRVHADRDKAPEDPHKFSAVRLSLEVDLNAIEDPEERRKLVDAANRAIDRQCTVSRTVREGTPITLSLPG